MAPLDRPWDLSEAQNIMFTVLVRYGALRCAPCALTTPDAFPLPHQHRRPLFLPHQVHESENGSLLRVLEAVRRGRQLKCAHCGRRGASVGCRVLRCKESYHAWCALQSGCTLYHKYVIACPDHAKRFHKDPVHPQ